ncbi:MAG: hypothetical protein Q8P48_01290, partial [Deltaproteobacteria bacterium]|nr:hypothetical protein [Deltaproteobacteria bacterium]
AFKASTKNKKITQIGDLTPNEVSNMIKAVYGNQIGTEITPKLIQEAFRAIYGGDIPVKDIQKSQEEGAGLSEEAREVMKARKKRK